MTPSFCHLHLLSQFSMRDSLVRLPALMNRLQALEQTSVALTDQDGLHGAVPFFRRASEHGIHPVIGCQLSVLTDDQEIRPVTLLAETTGGYSNLCHLITYVRRASPSAAPLDVLLLYQQGLILLTGGEDAAVPRLVAGRQEGQAIRLLKRYKEAFGSRCYLELQPAHRAPYVLSRFRELSRYMGMPPVATLDVRYLFPAEERLWRVQQNAHGLGHAPEQLRHLASEAEMRRLWYDWPEAVSNTGAIAARCRVDLQLGVPHLPKFIPPAGVPADTTNEQLLVRLCQHGLRTRYTAAARPAAAARLQHELDVIQRMGFGDYFLIAWDVVRFAKAQGIAFMPRGSGAGSLVTYLLGMSELCPIKHNLCFERFLNPERRELPDLDLDFDWQRRDEVVDYCFERYGTDHVARIATHQTLGCRGAVRVAGAGLGSPPDVIGQVAEMMPHYAGDTSIKEAMRATPELAELFQQGEPFKPLLQVANRFAGLPDHVGLHPCGIVISERPITDVVPLQPSAKGPAVTQWEMHAVEAAGLLKLDLLANRNLAILSDAVQRINERYGTKLVAKELPLDDEQAFVLLRTGRTLGIYQMESGGVQSLLRRFQPTNHEDIAAITSLYRPGPIEGGITPTYIARRQGKEPVTFPDPCLEPILGHTFGTILYQEQCLQVAHVFAGMSLGEADLLRRAIAKRKRADVTALRGRFLAGAARLGRDPAVAEHLFSRLDSFGGYGFVKAHAVCCAALAVRAAYLKARWPIEYLAAVLSTGMGYYPARVYIEDARWFGATLVGPCVNRSQVDYTVEDGQVLRVGLAFVKGIGTAAAEAIVQARGRAPFASLEDFLARTGLGKKEIEALIAVGALDFLGESRPALYWRYAGRTPSPADPAAPRLLAIPTAPSLSFPCPDYSPDTRRTKELALLEFTLAVVDLPRLPGTQTIPAIQQLPRDTRVQLVAEVLSAFGHRTRKGRELMSFLLISDGRHHIQGVLFPPMYRALKRQLRYCTPLLLTAIVDEQEGERVLVIGGIAPLQAVRERSA